MGKVVFHGWKDSVLPDCETDRSMTLKSAETLGPFMCSAAKAALPAQAVWVLLAEPCKGKVGEHGNRQESVCN